MVIFIGGSKGGVGKSLMAMIILNYFISKEEKPILIETDTDNPDVLKAYSTKTEDNEFVGKNCDILTCNMDTDAGWEKLLDVINENPDRIIVINSGARNSMALANYGEVLNELPNFKTIWLINTKADSMNLLTKYMRIVHKPICVIKNGFFGGDGDFKEFEGSKAANAGLKSVYLPKATEAVTNAIYTQRKAIDELLNSNVLTFGQRMLARSWVNKIAKIAEESLENAQTVTIEEL